MGCKTLSDPGAAIDESTGVMESLTDGASKYRENPRNGKNGLGIIESSGRIDRRTVPMSEAEPLPIWFLVPEGRQSVT